MNGLKRQDLSLARFELRASRASLYINKVIEWIGSASGISRAHGAFYHEESILPFPLPSGLFRSPRFSQFPERPERETGRALESAARRSCYGVRGTQ